MGNGVVSVGQNSKFARLITANIKGTKTIEENEQLKLEISTLQEELSQSRQDLQTKDTEVLELQKEVHKLKSVLQNASSLPKVEAILDSSQELHDVVNKRRILQKSFSTSSACKKQGVSAESSDFLGQLCNVKLIRIDKDLKSKQLIKEAIMANDFLMKLDTSQISEIVDTMYPRDYEKDSFVIKEGEAGSHLFVSADGEYEVIKDENVIGKIGIGEAFGELAILYNCTRTASIKAMSDCKVWVLERKIFQQIMVRSGLQRLQDNINFLKSIPLLNRLHNDTIVKMADVFKIESFTSGTCIIKQGSFGETFYIVNNGSVKVTHRISGNIDEAEIKILNKGDYFGEKAILNECIHAISVEALPPGVECITLDKDSFVHLIGDLNEFKPNLKQNVGWDAYSTCEDSEVPKYEDIRLNELKFIATLGAGGFGRVQLVQYKFNRSLTFALKCLKKKHIVATKQQQHVLNEKEIMKSCRNPFICKMYCTYKDTKYVYMLLEACLGGEVWTVMKKMKHFNDYTAKFITGCVVEALSYLHNKGIIYRDLKPENLILDSRGYVKLVDFGFSKRVKRGRKTWTFCGTPEYVPPEIVLNKGHDRAVDFWGVGILIYELLAGRPPFSSVDPMKTYNLILRGINSIKFSHRIPKAAQSLVKRLCREVPAERYGYRKSGIQEIKRHRWFNDFSWHDLRKMTLQAPIVPIVQNSQDFSNFVCFTEDNESPLEEVSGWDVEF